MSIGAGRGMVPAVRRGDIGGVRREHQSHALRTDGRALGATHEGCLSPKRPLLHLVR